MGERGREGEHPTRDGARERYAQLDAGGQRRVRELARTADERPRDASHAQPAPACHRGVRGLMQASVTASAAAVAMAAMV